MKNAPALVLVLLLLASCKGNKHTVKGFEEKAKSHKVIAVLPFNFRFTGEAPKTMLDEEIDSACVWLSYAYREVFCNMLIADSGKHPVKIKLLHLDSMRQKLLLAGEFWERGLKSDPKKICEILGVDAVVYPEFEQERLLAIESLSFRPLSAAIVAKVNPPPSPLNQNKPQIPGNAARSYRIKARCLLVNGADGTILWQTNFVTEAAWDDPAWTVINKVCKGLAKKFPYRNGPYGTN